MRAVVQRVTCASVSIAGSVKSKIGDGLVVLIGIEERDNYEDVEWLCRKIIQLRIFDDSNGIMNLSLEDTGGEMLIISQFTLHAKTKKGNRPSYIKAAPPDIAVPLYEKFIKTAEAHMGRQAGRGEFGAKMNVKLENSGPVTIIIDTKNKE